MEKDEIGKKFVTETTLTLLDDGTWRADLKVTQSRLKIDQLDWEKREATSSAFDADPQRAVASVNLTVAQWLQNIEFDLFNEKNDGKTDSIEAQSS